MRCIIYIMHRTQLYLEDSLWKTLQVRAKHDRCTISELVRQALREKFLNNTDQRREALLSAVGIWKNRSDLPETEAYIRGLRKSKRSKRMWK